MRKCPRRTKDLSIKVKVDIKPKTSGERHLLSIRNDRKSSVMDGGAIDLE
jgi:hypothetical protein